MQSLNVQHCPQSAKIFEEFVFAPCPQCATAMKNFNSKMTKMNGNGLNVVFKMIKLTSKTISYHLYQNILPLFTKRWPMFFKMGKKGLFFIKNFISIFSGQCPQCATLFWGVSLLHIRCAEVTIRGKKMRGKHCM